MPQNLGNTDAQHGSVELLGTTHKNPSLDGAAELRQVETALERKVQTLR